MELFHFSEDDSIAEFVPHVPSTNPKHRAAVWAIDDEHSPLYWFPRQCPRVSVWARNPDEQETLSRLFGTKSHRLSATEPAWREAMSRVVLYRYVFDGASFQPWDDSDGQFVAYQAVRAQRVEPVGDVMVRHLEAGIELRFVDHLEPLRRAILESGLPFSFVRLSNAALLAE